MVRAASLAASPDYEFLRTFSSFLLEQGVYRICLVAAKLDTSSYNKTIEVYNLGKLSKRKLDYFLQKNSYFKKIHNFTVNEYSSSHFTTERR